MDCKKPTELQVEQSISLGYNSEFDHEDDQQEMHLLKPKRTIAQQRAQLKNIRKVRTK